MTSAGGRSRESRELLVRAKGYSCTGAWDLGRVLRLVRNPHAKSMRDYSNFLQDHFSNHLDYVGNLDSGIVLTGCIWESRCAFLWVLNCEKLCTKR